MSNMMRYGGGTTGTSMGLVVQPGSSTVVPGGHPAGNMYYVSPAALAQHATQAAMIHLPVQNLPTVQEIAGAGVGPYNTTTPPQIPLIPITAHSAPPLILTRDIVDSKMMSRAEHLQLLEKNAENSCDKGKQLESLRRETLSQLVKLLIVCKQDLAEGFDEILQLDKSTSTSCTTQCDGEQVAEDEKDERGATVESDDVVEQQSQNLSRLSLDGVAGSAPGASSSFLSSAAGPSSEVGGSSTISKETPSRRPCVEVVKKIKKSENPNLISAADFDRVLATRCKSKMDWAYARTYVLQVPTVAVGEIVEKPTSYDSRMAVGGGTSVKIAHVVGQQNETSAAEGGTVRTVLSSSIDLDKNADQLTASAASAAAGSSMISNSNSAHETMLGLGTSSSLARPPALQVGAAVDNATTTIMTNAPAFTRGPAVVPSSISKQKQEKASMTGHQPPSTAASSFQCSSSLASTSATASRSLSALVPPLAISMSSSSPLHPALGAAAAPVDEVATSIASSRSTSTVIPSARSAREAVAGGMNKGGGGLSSLSPRQVSDEIGGGTATGTTTAAAGSSRVTTSNSLGPLETSTSSHAKNPTSPRGGSSGGAAVSTNAAKPAASRHLLLHSSPQVSPAVSFRDSRTGAPRSPSPGITTNSGRNDLGRGGSSPSAPEPEEVLPSSVPAAPRSQDSPAAQRQNEEVQHEVAGREHNSSNFDAVQEAEVSELEKDHDAGSKIDAAKFLQRLKIDLVSSKMKQRLAASVARNLFGVLQTVFLKITVTEAQTDAVVNSTSSTTSACGDYISGEKMRMNHLWKAFLQNEAKFLQGMEQVLLCERVDSASCEITDLLTDRQRQAMARELRRHRRVWARCSGKGKRCATRIVVEKQAGGKSGYNLLTDAGVVWWKKDTDTQQTPISLSTDSTSRMAEPLNSALFREVVVPYNTSSTSLSAGVVVVVPSEVDAAPGPPLVFAANKSAGARTASSTSASTGAKGSNYVAEHLHLMPPQPKEQQGNELDNTIGGSTTPDEQELYDEDMDEGRITLPPPSSLLKPSPSFLSSLDFATSGTTKTDVLRGGPGSGSTSPGRPQGGAAKTASPPSSPSSSTGSRSSRSSSSSDHAPYTQLAGPGAAPAPASSYLDAFSFLLNRAGRSTSTSKVTTAPPFIFTREKTTSDRGTYNTTTAGAGTSWPHQSTSEDEFLVADRAAVRSSSTTQTRATTSAPRILVPTRTTTPAPTSTSQHAAGAAGTAAASTRLLHTLPVPVQNAWPHHPQLPAIRSARQEAGSSGTKMTSYTNTADAKYMSPTQQLHEAEKSGLLERSKSPVKGVNLERMSRGGCTRDHDGSGQLRHDDPSGCCTAGTTGAPPGGRVSPSSLGSRPRTGGAGGEGGGTSPTSAAGRSLVQQQLPKVVPSPAPGMTSTSTSCTPARGALAGPRAGTPITTRQNPVRSAGAPGGFISHAPAMVPVLPGGGCTSNSYRAGESTAAAAPAPVDHHARSSQSSFRESTFAPPFNFLAARSRENDEKTDRLFQQLPHPTEIQAADGSWTLDTAPFDAILEDLAAVVWEDTLIFLLRYRIPLLHALLAHEDRYDSINNAGRRGGRSSSSSASGVGGTSTSRGVRNALAASSSSSTTSPSQTCSRGGPPPPQLQQSSSPRPGRPGAAPEMVNNISLRDELIDALSKIQQVAVTLRESEERMILAAGRARARASSTSERAVRAGEVQESTIPHDEDLHAAPSGGTDAGWDRDKEATPRQEKIFTGDVDGDTGNAKSPKKSSTRNLQEILTLELEATRQVYQELPPQLPLLTQTQIEYLVDALLASVDGENDAARRKSLMATLGDPNQEFVKIFLGSS
ncbi:unnamed protein product [Amoebophrya sp. A120]|nr:unnamed protein product [Amoebophrya sp. A120]|eukprot:GSA120T00000648001.1